MIIEDINGKQLINGDVIDLHQTINGQNLFIVLGVNPLNVVYYHDVKREYEYDVNDLFRPHRWNGECEFEIISNIFYSEDNHNV